MYFVLSPINFPVERMRIKLEASQAKFREGVQKKISAIPQEKLCEPDPQVIINTIHDSQYSVDKDELREMFENLIAAACSIDTAEKTHPSFSNIIHQMSHCHIVRRYLEVECQTLEP